MVPTNKRAPRAAPDALLSRVVFHDGRLVRRPDPAHALFALADFLSKETTYQIEMTKKTTSGSD